MNWTHHVTHTEVPVRNAKIAKAPDSAIGVMVGCIHVLFAWVRVAGRGGG